MSGSSFRRIAILIDSIDPSAAQQLLLQMPTDVAKSVRKLAGELEDLTECERQEVLAEFQQGIYPTCSSTPPEPETRREKHQWSELSPEIISSIMSNEQPLLIATLISDLDAYSASELLSNLPEDKSCQALKALKHLHEVDHDTHSQLQARLSAKFSEAEIRDRRSQQYQRQLSALVEAAPEELQQSWRTAIDETPTLPNVTEGRNRQENYFQQFGAHSAGSPTGLGEGHNSYEKLAPADHHRLTALEDLLELPGELLEDLFAQVPPETTLLSLAGANPSFVHQFCELLHKEDARELKNRLHSLSGIRISDIDDAQADLLSYATEHLVRSAA